jgi:rubredoxin
MKKYVCTACGYVYNPELGDPAFGIPAGTPFEELPESWVCPLCELDKGIFEEE